MEDWKLKALGIISPKFAKEYEYISRFLTDEKESSSSTTLRLSSILKKMEKDLKTPIEFDDVEGVDDLDLDVIDDGNFTYLYSQEEIKSILKIAPDTIDKLDQVGLVKKEGESLLDIDSHKTYDLYFLLRHVKRSKERMLRWACYYLFYNGKTPIITADVLKLNPQLTEKNVKRTLDGIIKQCTEKGVKVITKSNGYEIESANNKKLVADALIAEIEFESRWSSHDLEEDILRALDNSTYSNAELADMFEVDKSTISRVMKRLREDKLIKPSEHFGNYGKQFWITNCQNCPWGLTKDNCRKKSITKLQLMLNRKYGLELTVSYFDGVENNQTLIHLCELFEAMPEQNYLEIEKRRIFDRIIRDTIDRIGATNIEVKNLEYWIRDKKKERIRTLDLPFTNLLGINHLKKG